jgi:hypothetical protein
MIDRSLCNAIIERFQADPRRHRGMVGAGYSPFKRSTDLEIRPLPEWADVCRQLDGSVYASLARYREDVPNFSETHRNRLSDTEYQVQCYAPDGSDGFDWHADVANRASAERVLAMIAYLNDVAEGGETEFRAQQILVAPRCGSIIWFPPTFPYVHRGRPARSEAKYVVTCFLTYP